MGNIHTAGPNEALVISGGCNAANKKVVIGTWAWVWDCVPTDVQSISLEVMTLNPKCESVETAQGVAVTVTGVCQVKVLVGVPCIFRKACEQFLGKPTHEMESVIVKTFEKHLRFILGTITLEEINEDREAFATLVIEVAAPDVGRLGIEILSFTIKDIIDQVQ